MVVTLNPILESISGKIGNLVFYAYGGRQYARRYAVPRNPDTAAQKKRRQLFATAISQWQNLPAYKKEQWKCRARFAAISGYTFYISACLFNKEKDATKVNTGYSFPFSQIAAHSVSRKLLSKKSQFAPYSGSAYCFPPG